MVCTRRGRAHIPSNFEFLSALYDVYLKVRPWFVYISQWSIHGTLEVVRGGKTDEMKNPPVGITDEVRSDERGTNWDKGKRLANYIPLTRYNGDRTDETGCWINNAVSDFPSTSGGGGFESSSPEFFLSHIDIAPSFRNTMDMYT